MTTLRISVAEAALVIQTQINEGRDIVEGASQARSSELYVAWKRRLTNWIDVTKAALAHVYVGEDEIRSFTDRAIYRANMVVERGTQWPEWREWYRGAAEDGISRLEALQAALRFADAPVAVEPASASTQPETSGGPPTIFLVHGHGERRQEVARFLSRACRGAYEIVILDEQPDEGLTLIEKLERHAHDAAYAVILFTGDDVGAAKAEVERAEAADEAPRLNPRARQNVLFEFGWFCGQIRRQKVAVLYEADVELPSDITGLTYISLGADWRERLVRNIRATGLTFSMDNF